MGVSEFLAAQLRKPSGFFGRFVLSRLMNRAHRAVNQVTLESLALEPGDRVLEVGFGAGDLIGRLARVVVEGSVAGIDYSPDMVGLCTKRFASLIRAGRVELRRATAESLPFDAESFTKVCTVNTIYFWPDPAVTLNEFRRVLRPGGRLALSFSPRSFMKDLPVAKHGFTLYEPDQVRQLLENAGFNVIEMIPVPGAHDRDICAVGTT
jgi:ubiquinone/menaquinone biosynthesis C-methylase UbiE